MSKEKFCVGCASCIKPCNKPKPNIKCNNNDLDLTDRIHFKDWRNEKLSLLYSTTSLLNRYYNAKKGYYENGKSLMNDEAFDALEAGIKEIAGENIFKKYQCVGYDKEKHKIIKDAEYFYTNQFKELFNTR